jgi:hypothetical protein
MKQKHFYTLLIIFLGMLTPTLSHAQTDPPPDPIDTPIDGGLSILLAAGIGYGVKKAYEKRKKVNEPPNDVSNK